jgi:hypothetical protein
MFTNSRLLGAVCACTFAALALPTTAATMNYSSTPGSTVNLNPTDGCGGGIVGCFSFTTGNNIQITSGTALGFNGGITGTFGVGAITPSGSVESANVTGTGLLSIFDGSQTLTADLTWIDIATFGTAGNLNTVGSANLSNIVYGGVNADLLALASVGTGINTASFQLTSPTSLTNLFTTSTTVTSTSFSGSITAVPVPAAIWLFGSGLLGIIGIGRSKKAG